ncbi:histidine phosphatase family protein [Mesorhizobium sp. ZMM04-5]|uniref:Histidine phosphatase family protein n=1 Tax=Mesorhizobium marinum TaxID=3228790 RepID=A0ABV3R1Z4_9HYPH
MRHGHTAWNRAGRIQGRTDEPLDAEARQHLSRLRLPDEFAGATLFSSPLVRAAETARIVGRSEPVIVPELIEMDWGQCEGQYGVEMLKDPASGYRHIEEWGWTYRPPGGEAPAAVWERLEPWLRTLEGEAVVVSHIGIMRVLLARATGWDFEGPPPFRIKRDRLYRIDVQDSGALSHDGSPVRLLEVPGS